MNSAKNHDSNQVAALLQPEEIHLDVTLRDCNDALEFIARAIAAHHALDPAPIFRALSRREQAGSTALGGGFALPHASIPGIERPLTLLVRPREPIAFNASDHGPVSLMLAILVPERGDRSVHLKLLALVAELMSHPGFRTRLDLAADPASVARAFSDGLSALRA